MNTDIRLSVNFWRHPKTVKLKRRAGLEAVQSLQILWLWAAQNRPDGALVGLDEEDIEIAAEWNGESGAFLRAVSEIGWLDTAADGTGYVLHDWQNHNGWASRSDERGDKARFSRLCQTCPEAAESLRQQGITSISKEDYEAQLRRIAGDRPATARRIAGDRPATARRIAGEQPAPAPAPAPAHKDIADANASACAEVSQATPAAPEPEANQSALSEDPEPEALLPARTVTEPALLRFPLAGKAGEYHITQADVDEWQEAFPGVDVLQALKVCLQWNRDNPKRRKTRSGIRRHITSWLTREQNRSRAAPVLPGGQTWVQNQPMTANQRYMMEVAELLTNGDTHALAKPDSQRTQDTACALPGSWS